MAKSFKYALFMVLASIALSLILLALDLDKEQSLGFLGLIFTVLFLYLGIKDRKETEGNGFLTLGEGFKRGAGISIIASVLSAIYTFVYVKMINPSLKEFSLEQQYEKFSEQNMPEEQIEAAMSMMEKNFEVFGAAGSLFGGIIIGLIISLIISAILKKVDPNAMQ